MKLPDLALVACPRSAEEMFLSVGGRIGYFQGDPRKLVDDIGELRPTIFIGALLAAAFILVQASGCMRE